MVTVPRAWASQVVLAGFLVLMSAARANVDILLLSIEHGHGLEQFSGGIGARLSLFQDLVGSGLQLGVVLNCVQDARWEGSDKGCNTQDELRCKLHGGQ